MGLNQDLRRLGIAVYSDILKEARARCRGWNVLDMNAAQWLTVLQHETKKRLIRAFRDRHRNPGDYTRTGRLKR